MRLVRRILSLTLVGLLATNLTYVPIAFAVEPDTIITSSPGLITTDTISTFEFSADQEESITFECRIDGGPLSPCSSPFQTPALEIGAHVFEVQATNGDTETDASPATFAWEIISSEITNCEELINIDDVLDGDFELMSDLDCVSEGNDAMIGDNQNPFTGSFDGNDHTVTIDLDLSDNGIGLFSQVTDGGTVNNLTVAGSIGGSNEVGGIAGGVTDASFENIHNEATISGENSVGGLVGYINGGTSIMNSSSSGSVTGVNYIGGLVGRLQASSIASSSSTGAVNGVDNVGGAVGLMTETSEVVNSSASGLVQGASAVGGFVGGSYCSSSHYRSNATGDVIASGSAVGGYVGDDGCEGPGSTYLESFASGDVTGESLLGGFIGQAFVSTLDKTYALGDVTSTGGGYVGGLIGYSNGFDGAETQVDESFARGDVVANGTSVGGLVGGTSGDGNIFTDVFALGSVTGSGIVGGLLGYSTAGTTTTNAYATGLISSGDGNVGGLLGAGEGGTVFNSSFWDEDATQMSLGGNGTPKTTAEMQDIATFTDETTVGLAQAWDFVDDPNDDEGTDDIWFIDAGTNDGYPCFTWLNNSCDFESEQTPDVYEDLNGDSIPDSEQSNIGGYYKGSTGKFVAMDMGANCELTGDDMTEESNFPVSDPAYEYDNGLFEFTADCTVETTTIKLYYYDVSITDLVARKYSTITNSYFTLEDAVITQQTINGHSVAVVTYQLTDNSERDMDLEPGSIEDPAGLARSVLLSPNTGLGGI